MTTVKLIIEFSSIQVMEHLISELLKFGSVPYVSKMFPIAFLLTDDSNIAKIRQIPGIVSVAKDEETQVQGHLGTRDFIITNYQAKQILKATNIPFTGKGVVIAVLDSGINTKHPALTEKILGSFNFTSSSTSEDLLGHGTHVSGIIAGKKLESPFGITEGFAPEALLYNIKVFNDEGIGTLSSLIQALEFCFELDVDLINFSGGSPSLGTITTQDKLLNSLTLINKIACCATGNEGINPVDTPATSEKSIAVGGYSLLTDMRESYSNYGGIVTMKPDICGLSENIASTCAGSLDGLYDGKKNGFEVLSGTSMATPMITGLLAQLTEAKGSKLTREEIEFILSKSGSVTNKNENVGYGLLNAESALATLNLLKSGVAPDIEEPQQSSNFGVFALASTSIVASLLLVSKKKKSLRTKTAR